MIKKYCRPALCLLRLKLLLLKARVFKLPVNVVLGAGGTYDAGWIPTEIDQLNILRPGDWDRFFRADSVDAMLAEHVWEHLTPEQAVAAAENCYRYLNSGGTLLVAVPDANHPSPKYREAVRPGGSGEGSGDHRVFYTVDSLNKVFETAGFKVNAFEYFDTQGVFHQVPWPPALGKIRRSFKCDGRNSDGKPNYTSIIIGAVKEKR